MKCKSAGICVHCGVNAAVSGRVLCLACSDKSQNRVNDRIRRYRAAGLCQYCGSELDIPNVSKSRCSRCRGRVLARTRSRDKGKFAAYHRSWREKNHRLFRTIQSRHRFKSRANGGYLSPEQLEARIDYYGGLCYVCGAEYEQIDHVIPVALGGMGWAANLRPICAYCNQSKGDRPLREWLATRGQH